MEKNTPHVRQAPCSSGWQPTNLREWLFRTLGEPRASTRRPTNLGTGSARSASPPLKRGAANEPRTPPFPHVQQDPRTSGGRPTLGKTFSSHSSPYPLVPCSGMRPVPASTLFRYATRLEPENKTPKTPRHSVPRRPASARGLTRDIEMRSYWWVGPGFKPPSFQERSTFGGWFETLTVR